MKLSLLKNRKVPYLCFAFLVPFMAMLCVMIIRGCVPFGSASMLYSDMYHQYYPFFVDFRKALLSGDSLLYNWSIGMGIDYPGLIAYYLASPLNLLSVLIPEGFLLAYFSFLMPIKLGLAALFFAIFLKGLFRKEDFSIVAFGALYALCAWALGYQWNIMWLDTFALLPLVALGTVKLLRDRSTVLYTVTLFLSILTNYYIGFFVCIFVALIFLCYEICRWQGITQFFNDLCAMALYSALAIGMTAILTLPAYAALQTTQSSINKFPKGFRLNIADEHTWLGLLDAMRQVAGNMNGGLSLSFKEGLPNLYCGILTNMFAFLFFTCRQIKKRDRVCAFLLLVFFNLSFIIRQLDYIWHGFHFTNMIPYRFSFLYSFVMLYMAYRVWLLRNRLRLWQILVAGVLAIGLVLCSDSFGNIVYQLYNGVFLLLYLAILLYPHLCKFPGQQAQREEKRNFVDALRERRSLCSAMLLGVIAMELILNVVNFGFHFSGSSVSNYPMGTKYTQSILRYMEEREADALFYRTEVTHAQTLNDGALNGYRGISAFTSSANVKVTEFMKTLGYGAKDTYNRYCYEESSPVSNLFLNIKYMIERQGQVEENPYFDQVHQYGDVSLLENNAYLPLGFLAENQLLNVDFDTGDNTFKFQNDLFRAATGCTDDVWSLITGKNLSISGSGLTLNAQNQTGYCSYSTEENKGGTIVYKYIAPSEGLICVDLDLSKKNKFSFWKDNVELYNETYSIPQSLAVSYVEPGDVIEVHLTCNPDEKGTITLHAGLLNDAVFKEGYQVLSASTLQLTRFENTCVEGTIQCNRNGILYTSIPQNGNWSAYVDGKPVQIALVGDAIIALLLPEGEHTVTFRYHNGAFSLGWKLSLACAVIFLGSCITSTKKRKKQ